MFDIQGPNPETIQKSIIHRTNSSCLLITFWHISIHPLLHPNIHKIAQSGQLTYFSYLGRLIGKFRKHVHVLFVPSTCKIL